MQLVNQMTTRFMILCQTLALILCFFAHVHFAQNNGFVNVLSASNIIDGLRNIYGNSNTYSNGGSFNNGNGGYSYTYPINGNSFSTLNNGGNSYVATMAPTAIVYNNNPAPTINRRRNGNRDAGNFEYEYYWELGPDGKKRERFTVRGQPVPGPPGHSGPPGPPGSNGPPGRRFRGPWNRGNRRPNRPNWTDTTTVLQGGNQPIFITNGGSQPLQPQPQPIQPQPNQPQPIQPQPVRPQPIPAQPVYYSTAAPVYEVSEPPRRTVRPPSRVVAGTHTSASPLDNEDYVDSEEPSVVVTPASPSNESPLEKAAKVCGLTYNTRIVGGKDADPNTWIWMAALIRKNGSNYCGGALITDQHILTAAHCLRSTTPREMFVRLGAYDFTDDASATGEDYDIEYFRIHPQYDRYTHRNDIAILKMKKKAQFTHFIRPVCLPPKRRSYVNELATVVGWGSTDFGAPSSNKLREVTIPIWDNKDCTESYKQNITSSNLCAGFKEGGKDSCQGDSGGPLMLTGAKNKWIIVGIVSWGIRCGEPGYPGVYTRVNRYLEWLQSNVQY